MKNDLASYLAQEVTLTLPLSAVLRLAEEPVNVSLTAIEQPALPAIGAEFEGGVYAGLSIENERPVALVLLPNQAESVTWQQAKDWAAAMAGGKGKPGGLLPSRFDQLVLFKNLKHEFKEDWYWSGEELAGNAEYAWGQFFSLGTQHGWHKSLKGRARAVRRVPI